MPWTLSPKGKACDEEVAAVWQRDGCECREAFWIVFDPQAPVRWAPRRRVSGVVRRHGGGRKGWHGGGCPCGGRGRGEGGGSGCRRRCDGERCGCRRCCRHAGLTVVKLSPTEVPQHEKVDDSKRVIRASAVQQRAWLARDTVEVGTAGSRTNAKAVNDDTVGAEALLHRGQLGRVRHGIVRDKHNDKGPAKLAVGQTNAVANTPSVWSPSNEVASISRHTLAERSSQVHGVGALQTLLTTIPNLVVHKRARRRCWLEMASSGACHITKQRTRAKDEILRSK